MVKRNSGGSDTNLGGSCTSGNGLKSPTVLSNYQGGTATGTAAAGTPCALACHFSSTSAPNGLPADYYGLARAEGVTLRLDVLFSATEQVIQDMETSEAVANQLSVGVYQFNTDVFPIATGAAGDSLPEATSNLSSALSAVEAVDYKKTPTETAIPQLINGTQVSSTPSSTVANIGGDTDFPLSLSDLQSGNAFALKGGQKQPLTAAGTGGPASTPLKFMFIVTDGLEDDRSRNGDGNSTVGYNVEGEMTSIAGEGANNVNTGSCVTLKKTLG